MITRIEIDGFKSFLDFKLDVPPFLALVGPNASGKSNLFDALDYVRDSVLDPLGEEGLLGARRGRPHELFHRAAKRDSLRHLEIVVDFVASTDRGPLRIKSSVAANIVDLPDESSPVPVTDQPSFEVFDEADGTAAIEAWNREIRSWRLYLPDPGAMRNVGSRADTRALTENGENLAAVLGRLKGSTAFDDITVDFVSLVPDVAGIEVEVDERRQEWSFDVIVDGQGPIPSTVLSDGTLRILGLLTALHDPEHSGVLMIEEIENGLHPSRLAELLRRIQQRVTDAESPEGLLRQVILTSHSPVLVSELYRLRPDSLVFMDTAVRVDPENGRVSRVTVAKPVRDEGEPGTYVSPRQVHKYLSAVRQDEP
jgi:predicted ATPase